jgi:uncharacterized protein DUF4845
MGKIKAFIGLVVIVGAFYVAWNMIPPYFNHYNFQDTLDDIARKQSYTAAKDDDVKQMVIAKAKEMDIAVKEDQISVTRAGAGLAISVRYRVHVEMVVHPVDLDFTANSFNKRI